MRGKDSLSVELTRATCFLAALQKLDYLSLAGYKHEVTLVSQQTAKRLVSDDMPSRDVVRFFPVLVTS
jgi:hypothetical protein